MSEHSCSTWLSAPVTHGGQNYRPMRHQISSHSRNPLILADLRGWQKKHTHTPSIVSPGARFDGRPPQRCPPQTRGMGFVPATGHDSSRSAEPAISETLHPEPSTPADAGYWLHFVPRQYPQSCATCRNRARLASANSF